MRKIDRLIRQAREGCEWRGHKMGPFRRPSDSPKWMEAFSECFVCGAEVSINAHPQANQIDIGGPAIALNCPIQ